MTRLFLGVSLSNLVPPPLRANVFPDAVDNNGDVLIHSTHPSIKFFVIRPGHMAVDLNANNAFLNHNGEILVQFFSRVGIYSCATGKERSVSQLSSRTAVGVQAFNDQGDILFTSNVEQNKPIKYFLLSNNKIIHLNFPIDINFNGMSEVPPMNFMNNKQQITALVALPDKKLHVVLLTPHGG